jgi:hypothetical protein
MVDDQGALQSYRIKYALICPARRINIQDVRDAIILKFPKAIYIAFSKHLATATKS